MKKYHNVRRAEKFEALCRFLPKTAIEKLMHKEHHSFGMIRDMILRDIPSTLDDPLVGEYIESLQTFRLILQSAGLSFELAKYNKSPQWWKVQYRYPKGYTEAQIMEQIKKTSRAGQKKTVANRKKNGSYSRGGFERKWSPLVVDFYTGKGWDEESAKKRIKEICSSGAKAALRRTQSPTTEKRVATLLQAAGISYSQQFSILNENDEDDRKRFVFDFLLPDKKTIIEVNGDYWHANPLIYREDDMISHPGGKVKVKDIWERDKRKIDYATKIGYNVIVIWEYDINHNQVKMKEIIENV